MELSRRLNRFETRVDTLVRICRNFDHGGSLSTPEVYTVERAIIQLQIEWELYVRALILDSATGRFRDSSGRLVISLSARLTTREKAGNFLVAQYQRRRFEPDWYIPQDAIQATILLNLSNQTNISAQLGLSPWLLDDLRHLRNFIAHRSKRSALQLRQNSIVVGVADIDPIGSAFSYGSSGVKNYECWANFMKFVAKQLVT